MDYDRALSAIILIFLIIGVIGVFYMILNPSEVNNYSEFYLLGQSGKADNYPTNLSMGEKGNLTVGVINHELSSSNYQIQIIQNSQILKEENITLNDNEKQEIPFQFIAGSPGQYKLQFNLYKLPDTKNIYRSLYILVNVK